LATQLETTGIGKDEKKDIARPDRKKNASAIEFDSTGAYRVGLN
jgi:hypothetical protein